MRRPLINVLYTRATAPTIRLARRIYQVASVFTEVRVHVYRRPGVLRAQSIWREDGRRFVGRRGGVLTL